MKKLLAVIILLTIGGCSQKPNVVTLKSGLRYVEDTVGTGSAAKKGDLLTINFTGWIIKDSSDLYKDWDKDTSKTKFRIATTRIRNIPFKFLLDGQSFINGSDEGIEGMKVGGTRTIIIPSRLAYGPMGMGPIPPNSNLKLQVQLVSAKQPVIAKEWNVDSTKLKTTKDGLKYAIIQKGTGPDVTDGNIVTVNYTGYLINGEKFDSSIERDEPFSFKVGAHTVIDGWEEGVKLMNKGAKARFVIPPSLAYGNRAIGKIPPNSTVIFDVEVLDAR